MRKLTTKPQMLNQISLLQTENEILAARIKRLEEGNETIRKQNDAYSRQLALYIDQAADYAKNVMTMVEEGKQKDACIRELCRQVGK